MNFREEFVSKLIENTEYYQFAYNDHHAEQDREYPEIDIAQILLIRVDKETGYYCKYPGNEKYRVFLNAFYHSQQIVHPKEQRAV